MVRVINRLFACIMAKFIRIFVGDGNLPIALNLEMIESIDYINHRVYCAGASGDDCYHIHNQQSWDRICKYVDDNLSDKY